APHDVGPADGRPRARVGAVTGAEREELRPVTQAAGRAGLLDGRADHELSAGRCREVVALGLDRPGRPPAPGIQGGNVQVALAVQVDVAGRVGHRLYLPGAPVGRAGRRGGPGVLDP